MSRLWDKGKPLDTRILKFTAGTDHKLDARLVDYDVRASIAHARMLKTQGLLSAGDLVLIESGLTELGDKHRRGEWSIRLEDEDVHTALEARLTQAIGTAGARLHTGRSRNDQVLAALRLYLLDASEILAGGARALAESLEALGERQRSTPLPGYTHTQHAMPSTVGLWAEGFAAEIRDDAEGLKATQRRSSKNPLGSAAGFGVPVLSIDREQTRRELGFEEIHEPVTAVQLSRGKAESHLLFEVNLLLQDLGRLAADLILFYAQEFAFVSLPEAMTTGSSIMPQKRNPDVLELIRGGGATAHACLVEALGVYSKLTSGYHRDLQLLKAPLFRGIDLAEETLEILAHTLGEVRFIPENITMSTELYATEAANRLVKEKDMPFRDAYREVASRLDTKE